MDIREIYSGDIDKLQNVCNSLKLINNELKCINSIQSNNPDLLSKYIRKTEYNNDVEYNQKVIDTIQAFIRNQNQQRELVKQLTIAVDALQIVSDNWYNDDFDLQVICGNIEEFYPKDLPSFDELIMSIADLRNKIANFE